MSKALQNPVERHNARAKREGWATVCDDRFDDASASLKDLAAIWNSVRGARVLPMRADFSARVLARHLKDIAFLECFAGSPRRCRYGFFGSGLARYTGDFTGKYLDEVIPKDFLPAWNAAYEAVLDHGAPMRFVSQYRALNLDHMTAESFAAPLGDAEGVPNGLLVSVVYGPLQT